MRTPVLASGWERIVYYPEHHLNDFCLFRDLAGTWHAVGIKGTGTWASEQSLFHAVGASLHERFTPLADLLAEPAPAGVAPQKHAPFVVEDGGVYHLYYRRPPGTIVVARSRDPYAWPDLGEVVFSQHDARDVCILREGDAWLMYYCQSEIVAGVPRSAILLRRSPDLATWSDPVIVHVDTSRAAEHSQLESPYVVVETDGYYLFVRHRGLDERGVTTVYYGEAADRFPSGERAWFAEIEYAHAPELVRDADGALYIARVSGPPHAGPLGVADHGYVDVALLEFR